MAVSGWAIIRHERQPDQSGAGQTQKIPSRFRSPGAPHRHVENGPLGAERQVPRSDGSTVVEHCPQEENAEAYAAHHSTAIPVVSGCFVADQRMIAETRTSLRINADAVFGRPSAEGSLRRVCVSGSLGASARRRCYHTAHVRHTTP